MYAANVFRGTNRSGALYCTACCIVPFMYSTTTVNKNTLLRNNSYSCAPAPTVSLGTTVLYLKNSYEALTGNSVTFYIRNTDKYRVI